MDNNNVNVPNINNNYIPNNTNFNKKNTLIIIIIILLIIIIAILSTIIIVKRDEIFSSNEKSANTKDDYSIDIEDIYRLEKDIETTTENSRRDTFANTALEYIKAVKTEVQSDTLACKSDGKEEAEISDLPAGTYYYAFDSSNSTGTDLMEYGGKSSWRNSDVKGYIAIKKTIKSDKAKYEYSISMVDEGGRGIQTPTNENDINRNSVKTSGQKQQNIPDENYSCSIKY